MQRWLVRVYPRPEDDGWSSNHGLWRGFLATTAVAFALSAAVCLLAWAAPHVVVDDFTWAGHHAESWGRAFPWGLGASGLIGAVVGFLLVETMQRTSGMAGNVCMTYTVLMAGAVIASKHVLFALRGVEVTEGFIQGWVWLTPEYLLWYSYGSWVGLGAILLWRHFTDH